MTNENKDYLDQLSETAGGASATSDPLVELVGEGKKFKDTAALAKAKLDSDSFIEQLKRENAETRKALRALEEEKTKATTLTEILNEIKNASKPEGENQRTEVSMDEILKVVDSRLTIKEQEKQRAANRAHSNATITNKFKGDNAAALEYVRKRVGELGLRPEQARELSETSPTAFLTLLGVNEDRTKGNDVNLGLPKASVNTEALANSGDNGVRNQKYYAKLLKEMGPAKFFKNFELQSQKHKDLERLGDSFFE